MKQNKKKKEKGLLNRISGFCESSQMELKHTNTFYDERQKKQKILIKTKTKQKQRKDNKINCYVQ